MNYTLTHNFNLARCLELNLSSPKSDLNVNYPLEYYPELLNETGGGERVRGGTVVSPTELFVTTAKELDSSTNHINYEPSGKTIQKFQFHVQIQNFINNFFVTQGSFTINVVGHFNF